jgi:CIC family chloride channel protein
VSFFLMENTIMTEKIARRGVFTPDSFEADLLGKLTVEQAISNEAIVLSADNSIGDVKDWLKTNADRAHDFVILNHAGAFTGIISRHEIFNKENAPATSLGDIVKDGHVYVKNTDPLRKAVEVMAKQTIEVVPVLSAEGKVVGVLSYRDILSVYKEHAEENEHAHIHISLKRQRLKMLIKGRKLTHVNDGE